MQTRHVLTPHALNDGDSPSVRQLISVFLSPDVRREVPGAEIRDRVGEQRLDGVLRFGDELVVVIESKIISNAPTDQAVMLHLRGVEVEDARVTALGWHDLLEDWWALLERDLLAPRSRC